MITRRCLLSCSSSSIFFSICSKSSIITRNFSSDFSSSSDDLREGFDSNNNNNNFQEYGGGGNDDYDDFGGNGSKRGVGGVNLGHGVNPADFASSGIHGPAATVARRDMSPEAQGKHAQDFNNAKLGRCVLCDENIGSWAGHVCFVSHQARLSIVERVMSGACGPPRYVVERWWQLLNSDPEGMMLNRIRSLSSDVNSEKRRERLIYLLRFLQANGVLKVALGVYDDETKSFGRSNVFERFEMVGDNVVKVVFYDRLQSLFPLSDGGAAGKMNQIQQLIDSNEGLLQAFDYLELDKIIGTSLSQSKFKSDVMEALFGELQTYLWAVTHHWNTPVEYSAINAAAGPELKYLEAVVRHTLLELTDSILLFAVESSVTRAAGLIQREYKGANIRKPIPLSKNEMEKRRLFQMMKQQQQLKDDNVNNNNKLLLQQQSASDALLLLLDSSKYAMRPFLASESTPSPSKNENDSFQSGGDFSSSSSSEFGLSVIKPLAQRLAEEEGKRKAKEATWKIEAPYFSRFMLDDAEAAFEDFHQRMVNAAFVVEDENEIKNKNINDDGVSEESLPQQKLQQKNVKWKHLEDFSMKNIENNHDLQLVKFSCLDAKPVKKVTGNVPFIISSTMPPLEQVMM